MNIFDKIQAEYRITKPTIFAIAEVESGGRTGFLPDGQLQVLFEAHLFYRELKKLGLDADDLAKKHPDLISKTWNRKLYKGGSKENDRLSRAMQIHPCAAFCASYGMFQILGSHWRRLGFSSVTQFVEFLQKGRGNHVIAFVHFIVSDRRLKNAVNTRNWADFAKYYNGADYAVNKYDEKIAAAYAKYKAIEDAKGK